MNVAVFLPNWIGDVVMATPALRALRSHFRDARLVGVLKPYVAGVLEGGDWFDELIFVQRRLLGTGVLGRRAAAARRRHRPCRSVPQLVPLGPDRLARRLPPARWLRPLRPVPAADGRRCHRSRETGRQLAQPGLRRLQPLAEHVGCPARAGAWSCLPRRATKRPPTPSGSRPASRAIREVVCLNPGAAFGAAKYWPAEHFAALARDLADRRGCGVLVLCGPSETELARRASRAWPARRRPRTGDRRGRAAAFARLDQGVRPPRRPAGHHRQRPAPLRRRLRPARRDAVRADAHRLDGNVLPAGGPLAKEGGRAGRASGASARWTTAA